MSPAKVRLAAGAGTVFFIVLIPVAYLTGAIQSIAFCNLLSLVALVLSCGSWWSAADAGKAAREEQDDTPPR